MFYYIFLPGRSGSKHFSGNFVYKLPGLMLINLIHFITAEMR